MTRPFRFKQFTIVQEKTPMKVGTDGVLLGAWCSSDGFKRILDVGTGTGLLALMMAQRNEKAMITAVEFNGDAIVEAENNFKNSPWQERLKVVHSDVNTMKNEERFDLILTNPPFFQNDLTSKTEGKSKARHADTLDIIQVANLTRLLEPEGILAGIYPMAIFQGFHEIMTSKNYSLKRKMEIQPTPEKEVHRVLFEYAQVKTDTTTEETLIIEDTGRHGYSEAYKNLTKDFYLNF